MIIVASGNLLRQILLEGHTLGMGNGEYSFLTIELIKSKATLSESSWYRTGDKRNKDARDMFESLLQVAVRVPTSSRYSNFVHQVIQRSHTQFGKTVTDVDVSRLSMLAFVMRSQEEHV